LVILDATVLAQGRLTRRPTSVLVEHGRVVRTGTREEILPHVHESAKLFPASRFTLLPGFIDAHLHLMSLGASLREVDARYPRVASVDDLAAVLAVRAAETERGVWIRGRGLDYARFPDGRMPTRWDLDAAAPDNPVAIIHISGHYALVNTVALASAGVGEMTSDPRKAGSSGLSLTPCVQAHRGIERVRQTPHLVYSFLRHAGLSVA